MRTLLLITIAMVTFAKSSITGEQAPDLTGTWILDVGRSASAAIAGHLPRSVPEPPMVEMLVIRQTADALIVERRRGAATSEAVAYSFKEASPAEPPIGSVPEAVGSVGVGAAAIPQPVGTAGAAEAGPLARRGTNNINNEAAVVGVDVKDARATIKDGRIVATTVMNVNGKTVTTDETFYATENGRELIVERLLRVHHGYEGATRSDAVGKDVFVRAQ
jgi:hypothetical protein